MEKRKNFKACWINRWFLFMLRPDRSVWSFCILYGKYEPYLKSYWLSCQARDNLSDLVALGHLENKLSDSHTFVRHCVPSKAVLCLSPVKGGFKGSCLKKIKMPSVLLLGKLPVYERGSLSLWFTLMCTSYRVSCLFSTPSVSSFSLPLQSNLSDLVALGHLENKLSDSHTFVRHCVPSKAALCLSPVKGGFKGFKKISCLWLSCQESWPRSGLRGCTFSYSFSFIPCLRLPC